MPTPEDTTAVGPAPDLMRDQVERVASARQWAAAFRTELDAEQALWESEHAVLLADVANSKRVAIEHEQALRAMVVAHYKASGEKKPAPGIGIRLVTTLEYEAVAAFEWAKTTGLALVLDRSAFEQIAKATPLPFVRITDTPEATIAKDLDAALANGGTR